MKIETVLSCGGGLSLLVGSLIDGSRPCGSPCRRLLEGSRHAYFFRTLGTVPSLLALMALVLPTAAGSTAAASVLTREFIAGELPTPSCHASTIVEAEPGELVAAWFGGQREGVDDVGIWVSRQAADGWTQPVEVAVWKEPDGSQQPCWNPVLFRLEDGRLALFYKASGNPRTWKGLVRYSADAGRTWSDPEPLRAAGAVDATLSGVPVGPVKNKPVQLADGTLLAGSSTEDKGWRAHFERSTDGGKTWQVIGPVNDGEAIGAIQPSILKLGGSRLLAVGRTRDSRKIFRIASSDNGVTWGAMSLTELPNPNSGTDAVTLADGRHLLVYNHTEKGRSPLNVAVSDDGATWRNVLTLEDSPGEYSYPAIIQSADGLVHVSYTWKRKKIAHVVIDPRQLSGAAAAADAISETVPGVVIDHVPAATGTYVGSPSIAILPDGTYVASHDFFGPKSNEHRSALTAVFSSSDRGATWREISQIDGAFWSNLFVHRGDLYLMGTTHHHGLIVIRRSRDGGTTWTTPVDAATGLLTPKGEYHTAPMPVIAHDGRLWRAFEDAGGGTAWGKRYMAMMLSVPEEADLLNRTNWTFTNAIPSQSKWLDGRFNAWLEGNAVVDGSGQLLNMLRVDLPPGPEQAAIVTVSADGQTAAFESARGFVEFPGGAKKFSIRRDPRTQAVSGNDEKPIWWTLATAVPPRVAAANPRRRPGSIRNTLVLMRSEDLRQWEICTVLLHHPEVAHHGFQYVDWLFDGDDIVAACRTAYDDATGGAHNNHDANFLTFHRVTDFRGRTMADSVVDPASLGW